MGTNTGNVSDNRGSVMYAKRVIMGGFRQEKGGGKGVFCASEAGKTAFFACGRGNWGSQRGFRARLGHYVITRPRSESPPGGDAKGETDSTGGRSAQLPLREELAAGIRQNPKHADTLSASKMGG